jgi:hypothetical protein
MFVPINMLKHVQIWRNVLKVTMLVGIEHLVHKVDISKVVAGTALVLDLKQTVFLVRITVFLVRITVFLVRITVFLVRITVFLVRITVFLVRITVFLVRITVFGQD